MKYYLVCTGDKPVNKPRLKVSIASKVYANGSLVEVIDGVAKCDIMRRFVKAKYIKEITFDKYNELRQGTVKKSKKEPEVIVEPTPEVEEPEVIEPTSEVEKEPEVVVEPTPEVEETKATKKSSRRRNRNKNKEV